MIKKSINLLILLSVSTASVHLAAKETNKKLEVKANATSTGSGAIRPSNQFTLDYIDKASDFIPEDNLAIFSLGVGLNKTTNGEAFGFYVAGLGPISDSNFGIYGRGQLIADEYKTGTFWSWNMAVGGGYYFSKDFAVYATVGKCFSNYSTCYFNNRIEGQASDDIDSIYYGVGTYLPNPFFSGVWEVAFDWSPYKGYNGSALYLGYGFTF